MLCNTTPRLENVMLVAKVTFLKVKYLGWLVHVAISTRHGFRTHLLLTQKENY